MMKKRTLLRLCALLLTLASLLSIMPVSALATDTDTAQTSADAPKVMVLHDGAQKASVTLDEDGRETLEVFTSDIGEGAAICWQILIPDTEQWVSIRAKTKSTLDVTYSLVGSMLNGENKAYIRCTVKDGEALHVSEPVEIVTSYAVADGEAAESLSYAATPMLLASDAETEAQIEAVADTTTTPELYTIIINYIFDNGAMAFEPYGASIAAGSEFKHTVASPTVVGYEPFRRIETVNGDGTVSGNYEKAATVVFDIESMTGDMVINVIYEPALVSFTVHHHYQDLYNDSYSTVPDKTTTGTALTGSATPTTGLELDMPGFKALAYNSMTVAADGSTVVEIRYDRNYYLVNFLMDGGWGTEPVYTRFGSEVSAADPTRPGYVFSGWELVSYGSATPTTEQASQYDINAAKKVIVPDANLTYKAIWANQETTYTMVFWAENINDNGFSYWGYLGGLPAMSGTLVSGEDRADESTGISDYDQFNYCDALTDKNVLVEGDGSTVVNVYYTRNRYTITFKADALCAIPEGHAHGDACYDLICNKGHVHTAACNPQLTCTVPEHGVHVDACIVCGIEAHSHTSACCPLPEHTHTMACWTNYLNISTTATTNLRNAPTAPEQGQIFRGRTAYSYSYRYYIYLNGNWYLYSQNNASSGDVVDARCGYTAEHAHGNEDCECAKAPHSHTDECYKDTLHTHGTDCYSYSCGDDPHVHVDGCYILDCGITEGHTHTASCNNANQSNTVKVVYKKYQQDLSDIWPIVTDHASNPITYDGGQRWTPSGSSEFSNVLVFIANMPDHSFTLTLSESSADTFTMNYYLEVLPWETGDDIISYECTSDGTTRRFRLYTTVNANYNYLTEAEDFFDINGYYKIESDPAFTNGQVDIAGGGTVNMYYGRNVTQKLEFQSEGVVVDSITGIMYGESLEEYADYMPAYPSTLEANAYEFGGWYTSPNGYEGTEVDWATETMAAGNVMYYAKWVPIVHTVKVYLTSELNQQIGATQSVSHGEFATAPTETVENGNYIFQGWFYSVDGKEKAFTFNGIPISEDMNVYAKWSSYVYIDYTINYVLQETGEAIADPTKGSALAGNNLTFEAKAGTDLYAAYRIGFYPLTSSHTVTMNVNAETHEYTFEYIYVESIPYLVKYLDASGKSVVEQKKVTGHNLAVVTETFVPVSGMMPDAYQKRLVLSASGADADNDGIIDTNIITFNYSVNTKNAYCHVVHYVQDIHDESYREYRSEDIVGEIGKATSFKALSISGFSLSSAKVDGTSAVVSNGAVSATVTASGLLVEFYYDRVNVTYTVNYLEYGTDKVLYTQKTGTGIFGEQVLENAPGLTHLGYTPTGDSIKQIHLSTDATANVITFYYTEITYSFEYVIVGSTDGGTLSYTSENIKAATGTPTGSVPTVKDGYHFVGWFLDESCTTAAPTEWINATTNAITPQKTGDAWLANQTLYARIEPDYTTLTITVSGADVTLDANQTFIFQISGKDESNKDISLTVTVNANSSVTVTELLLGDYTVTELTEWSFRYTPDATSKSVTLGVDKAANAVTFNHARTATRWLDGNHNVINKYS